MRTHTVRTFRSADPLAREDPLAWKIAEVVADPVAVPPKVVEMIGNRLAVYLAAVIDWFSRGVLVWRLSITLGQRLGGGAGVALNEAPIQQSPPFSQPGAGIEWDGDGQSTSLPYGPPPQGFLRHRRRLI